MMFRSEISKEEVAELDLIQFEGPIELIDNHESFQRAIDEIENSPVLGIDTETRPSFKKGTVYPTSLIQLSNMEKAWIIRVSRMGYPERLIRLFTEESPMKIGLGLQDDIRKMRADFQFDPAGFLDLQSYVEAFRIEEKGLKKLSGLVLGKRISKSQQVSNWDAELLTEAQIRYAATDAWICLKIYERLRDSI